MTISNRGEAHGDTFQDRLHTLLRCLGELVQRGQVGRKRFIQMLAERAGQKEERHSSRYHEPLKQPIAIALGPLPHCPIPPRFAGP